jgi:uncharacterized protein YyaL (SSP411 family)/thiol-disulfide isomerase/thioredoxin
MANRLAEETSPYLLQHAHNPVDWYPWGEEALRRAREEQKPILLSVGYSACHWCHVMERESFEDAQIAALMNRDFVCVKVDREERPDLDSVYMQAVQAFTGGHGGWPMTLFLTPEGKPFVGGTYFPPSPRGGMPGFPQVMEHAARVWREHRDKVDEVGDSVVEHIQGAGRLPAAEGGLEDDWLTQAARAADKTYDEEIPGLGEAPRFPRPWTVAALLAHWRRTGWARSLQMARGLLDAMAIGGMYDVLGGGFARYSVDREWLIPHFEKMLYDNAMLAPVYADAFLATGEARYGRIARETLDFMLAELRDPAGAFTSALDADSEGEEGLYYTWTPILMSAVLGPIDGARAAALLGVTREGNFEHGRSALRPPDFLEALDPDDRAFLEQVTPQLLAARETRVRPGLDDKVITAWNGLAISAFARGAAALGEPRYAAAAAAAADFLLEKVTVDGRLRRTWKADRVGAPAFLDDYAALTLGLIDLYEATAELRWLEQALALAERTVALFWDEEDGGFFYTGADAEALVARQKPLPGGAIPSGNELAALAFCRLETLCERSDLGEKAERVLLSLQPLSRRAPSALGPSLLAAAWRTGPVQEVGVAGGPEESAALLAEVRRRYSPFRVVARVDPGPAPAILPWMAGRSDAGGPPTAYVCVARACLLPAREVGELAAQLDQLDAPSQEAPKAPVRVRAPELPADPARWLNTDTPLTLEALAGQVVVLDFWTYCCINCHHVLPELAAIEERFAGRPVAVIGVHSAKFPAEKEAENVARAVARHGVRHPVVLDPDHDLWQRYTVKSWPTIAVLDTTGRIALSKPGEVDRETLGGVIERLLAEGAAAGTLAHTPAWTPPQREASAAALRFPGKVHVHPSDWDQARGASALATGTLYLSDTGNHRVIEARLRKGLDGWPRAEVTRIFGDGEPGLADGASPRFREPQGLYRLEDALWVADTGNHALRRIDLTTGEVRTVAGTGRLGRGRSGQADRPRSMDLRSPWDVVAQDGVVFIAMAGTHQIWIYLPEKDQIGPFAGSGVEDHVDGAQGEAALAQPSGLSLLGSYLFFADSEVSSVRVLELHKQEIGTIVGKGLFDFGDVDGPAPEVLLQHPLDLVATPQELYVADTFNHKVKRIDLGTRVTTTLAGGDPEQLCEPGGLARADDFLIVADTNNHRLRTLHRRSGVLRDLPLDFPR